MRRRIYIAAGALALTLLAVVVASTSLARPEPKSENVAWAGTWAAAQAPAGGGVAGKGFTNQTVRMTIRTSIGGDALRIRLSNTFGTQALTIGRATVATPIANDSPQINLKSLRELTFNGSQGASIPKGGQIFSDPVTMAVARMQELTISIFLPVATGPTTFHFAARETSFFADGDQTAKADYVAADTRPYWFFLSGVDVSTPKAAGSVVVLGDSLADGFASTLGLHRRWPDYLAERLLKDQDHAPGVLNNALSGSGVLHDGSEINLPELGVNGLARFHRDVAAQTGVHTVILALGINDIQLHDERPEKIIDGLRQLATQARELGLRVLACTLTPFEGFTAWTPGKENTRQAVNAYLRDSKLFDEVVDFDALVRDPAAPTKLKPQWDSGDHIHPNDTGYEAMAGAVPLALLSR